MVTAEAIEEAGRVLAQAAQSATRVILFGSWARGTAQPDSDLDFLVVEKHIDSKLEEMVRLRDALPFLGVPVDVLVTTEQQVERWRDVPGTLVHAALSEGRVLVES